MANIIEVLTAQAPTAQALTAQAPIFSHLEYDVPFPAQIKFFCSNAKNIAYGGARGGGKSWAMRRKFVMMAMRYKGLKLLLLRRSYKELLNNHINPLRFELNGYAKFNSTEKCFIFPNGSRLDLGYCDNDNDCMQYQGTEYDIIGFEEATNFEEEWIKTISACLRTTRENFIPRIYYTCNPGGVGHNYIKRLFIDRKFQSANGERPENFEFIPAKVTDNKVLMKTDPDYIMRLQALPPKLRKAHLEGCWDIYDGQFFEEFRNIPENYETRRFTHVIAPFEIPDYGFTLYRSFDWGYSKPFSCNWYAVDGDGRIYMIMEYYGCVRGEPDVGVKLTPDEVFSEIANIEKNHKWFRGKDIHGVADPAIWNKESGISVAEAGEKHGVYFDKGDNARLPGWLQVHERLRFDESGIPMLYFFSTCENTIRTMPQMQYDTKKVEDLDTKLEDHAIDSLRYMCNLRPIKPQKINFPKEKPYNPLEDEGKAYGHYEFYTQVL